MARSILYLLFLIAMFSCKMKDNKTIGTIERIDPELDAIIGKDPQIEIIAEGFEWSEGPLWVEEHKMLLFSDVPNNIIHRWTADKGTAVYLTPSGYTGTTPRAGETGSNGLLLRADGKLVLCQHGDRRMAVMNAPLHAPQPVFIPLADNYKGKKFNSPNDAVFNSKGELFFTDPPYGLPERENDPTREISFQGVYKVAALTDTASTAKDTVTLVTDSLTRPNGIAFLPGEKTLIVANSDPEKAIWYAFDLDENNTFTNARIFYDATPFTKSEKGLPDGLKIDRQGNIFASGPGGIWIFNKTGKVLGKIKMTETASNCALADNDKTLYITADMYVVKVRLRD